MLIKSESSRNNSEMSDKITLNVLTKFIKSYNGDRETLPAFLTNCENAMSLASPEQNTVLCKYILSQLEGKAQVACSLKSFSTWPELKTFLRSTFGEKKHSTHLMSDLQHCKQLSHEDVTKFSLRIESLLTRILSDTHHSCKDEKELPGRVAAMEDLALNTFMLGLTNSISNVVRCKNPSTLNEAIQYAIDEEKLYNITKFNTKSIKQCSICNRLGHNSSECFRNKKPKDHYQKSYHVNPQINSHANSNTTTYPNNSNSYPNTYSNPSTNSNSKTCNYCKHFGHTIDQCRKRQFNMQRRQNADSGQRYRNSPTNSAPAHTCEYEHNYNNTTESYDDNLN